MKEKTYYLVGNGTWTSKPTPLSFFTKKGAEVTSSRLDGDLTLWIGGNNMGILFEKQSDQIKYLRHEKLIRN